MIFKNFLQKIFLNRISYGTLIICFFSFSAVGQIETKSKGDVTGLPLPRFVSVKSSKVNVRRGPSYNYQIDWVYTRAGVPLKVIAEHGNWRKVEDFQGEGGWIHSRLLSGKKFVIFVDNKTILLRKRNKKSPPVAIVNQGVIGRLVSTVGTWSEISVNGYSGWVPSKAVWGSLMD